MRSPSTTMSLNTTSPGWSSEGLAQKGRIPQKIAPLERIRIRHMARLCARMEGRPIRPSLNTRVSSVDQLMRSSPM